MSETETRGKALWEKCESSKHFWSLGAYYMLDTILSDFQVISSFNLHHKPVRQTLFLSQMKESRHIRITSSNQQCWKQPVQLEKSALLILCYGEVQEQMEEIYHSEEKQGKSIKKTTPQDYSFLFFHQHLNNKLLLNPVGFKNKECIQYRTLVRSFKNT